MRDLLDILTAAASIPAGEPYTLATVVGVDGSSYRGPGARMLVDAAGRRFGSVSGGCLESDVARRGRLLTPTHSCTVANFDSTDDDAAWGYGLGCNGSIEVLIERCVGGSAGGLGFIRDCVTTRTAGVMATVFDVAGDLDLSPGVRLYQSSEGLNDPADLAGRVPALLADLRTAGRSRQPFAARFDLPGGRFGVFIEPVRPPLPIVIFGAGHDAVPLAAAAKALGWSVTIWDRRPGHARADRFPGIDAVIASDPADALAATSVTPETVAIVMNHHYPTDAELACRLLDLPARYVGVLGPRARTDRILTGRRTGGDQRLFAPVGLDLGADGPEQVAVAVVAEILAVTSGRPGGPLRLRDGPIHSPVPGLAAVLA
jgi:xanthine dehydrogenase accessory factor